MPGATHNGGEIKLEPGIGPAALIQMLNSPLPLFISLACTRLPRFRLGFVQRARVTVASDRCFSSRVLPVLDAHSLDGIRHRQFNLHSPTIIIRGEFPIRWI